MILGIGLIVIDPLITVFAAMFFAAVGLLMHRMLANRATRMGKESAEIDIEAYQAIQEALAGYREIVVSHRRWMYVERIRDLRWKAASINADSQFILLLPKYGFEIALVVGASALAISQVLLRDVAAAFGLVAIFLVAGSRVVPAVLRLQVSNLTIRRAEAPARKVFHLMRELGAGEDPPEESRPSIHVVRGHLENGYPDFSPELRVDNLRVSYPEARVAAVSGVSFAVQAGSSVALVGATGAGKSTLADLILGVLIPDQGQVLIGGLSPKEAIARWPGGIAYVPQEVALVNGSIRRNVTAGLPPGYVDDSSVLEALERADLWRFLKGERNGLDTTVGEGGLQLSGGQRQRLGLARALLTRPRLLVLDEATSALDAETEDTITRTLEAMAGSVTTVMIAHRLASVRHSDLVVYLERGAVAASGSFQDVRSQSAAFNRQANLLGL